MSAALYAKYDVDGLDVSHPDSLSVDGGVADNFVVSRSKDGAILSVYGDIVWNLLPYSRVSMSRHKLRFNGWHPKKDESNPLVRSITEQLKQIMLCEIYQSDIFISVSTVQARFHVWSKIAKNLILQGKCFATASDEEHLPFIKRELLNRPSFGQLILPRIRFSQVNLPNKIANFSFLSSRAYDVIHKAGAIAVATYKKEQSKQTTVVPSRIYGEMIVTTTEFIDDFNLNSGKLFRFLSHCNVNPAYGRSIGRQTEAIKKMIENGTYPDAENVIRDSRGFIWWQKFERFEHGFDEAIKHYGLDDYFDKYDIRKFNDIRKLLTDVHRAANINISIFTGARQSEVASLPAGCLSTIKLDGEEHVLISGYSSKMQQTITDSEWVADTSTKSAVQAARDVTAYVCKCNNIEFNNDTIPLFLKVAGIPSLYGTQTVYSTNANTSLYDFALSQSTKTSNVFLQRFPDKFKITQSDISEVIDIDPHYGYSNDERFTIGSTWPLADHQLRRSLVVYAFSEGVAHPELKWQLKHISLAMTLWYGRNGAFAKAITQSSDHIYKDYQGAVAEYEAAQYLANVISEEVKLHGTHGVFVSNMIVKHGHDETRRLVARGELAYKETPIGGCVSTSGCSMDAFLNITSCIPCKSAVFTTNDIPKIDRAISHITNISETSETQSQAKISADLQLVELNRLKTKVANND